MSRPGSPPPIPDEAFCPKCERLLTDYPDLDKLLASRGLTAAMPGRGALCTCDSRELEEASRQRERVRVADLPHQQPGQKSRTFGTWKKRGDNIGPALAFAQGEGPHLLVMAGVTGCGKSHLLEAIGRRSLDLGLSVKYVTTKDYLRRIRADYSSEKSDPIVDECYGVNVLLLDEVGAESNSSASTQAEICSLVDERYRSGKRLAVATNLSEGELVEREWHRLASRLWDTGTGDVSHLILKAPDYRKKSGS